MGLGDRSIYLPYGYHGFGASVGAGFTTPVAFSISSTDFWSTGGELGRLYLTPKVLGRIDLNEDTINGPAVLISPGFQGSIFGFSVSLILFGAEVGTLSFNSPASLLMTTTAVAFQAGQTLTSAGFSAGVEVQQLWIGKRGKIVKMD